MGGGVGRGFWLNLKKTTARWQVERPVIKKLVDTLQTSRSAFEASSTLRDDFPEQRAVRPHIHRIDDQLHVQSGEMSAVSHRFGVNQ